MLRHFRLSNLKILFFNLQTIEKKLVKIDVQSEIQAKKECRVTNPDMDR